jgi:phenylacetate-CoA ligase
MSVLKNPYLHGDELVDLYSKMPEDYWVDEGSNRALKLFHEMSNRVPAYKKFLKKHHIDPKNIKDSADFKKLPTLDKENYLRQYSLQDLSWDGNFPGGQHVISATSGSTGLPFYFPRSKEQDLQYAAVAEAYLRTNFDIDKKSTLYIIGFPMGVWIGGVFTYQALQYIAERGNYDMSIITPGIHKEEIIKAIKNLGSHFDQIIIGSYGPFLKDVLDDGVEAGLDWKKHTIKCIFSAEGFSEEFREFVGQKI